MISEVDEFWERMCELRAQQWRSGSATEKGGAEKTMSWRGIAENE